MTEADRYHDINTNWHERVRIMALFHYISLRDDSSWNCEKTAEYFGIGISTVAENLQIASRLAELKSIGSRNKALKKIRGII